MATACLSSRHLRLPPEHWGFVTLAPHFCSPGTPSFVIFSLRLHVSVTPFWIVFAGCSVLMLILTRVLFDLRVCEVVWLTRIIVILYIYMRTLILGNLLLIYSKDNSIVFLFLEIVKARGGSIWFYTVEWKHKRAWKGEVTRFPGANWPLFSFNTPAWI